MPPDVPAIVTAHTRDDLREHPDGCELDHPVCAILHLAAEAGKARARASRLEQAIVRHHRRRGRRAANRDLWDEIGGVRRNAGPVGGYVSSSKPAGQLGPPPSGPAPGSKELR